MNHPLDIPNWRCASIPRNASFMSLGENDEFQNHALHMRENYECPCAWHIKMFMLSLDPNKKTDQVNAVYISTLPKMVKGDYRQKP